MGKTLYIIRGASGSGKSSLSRALLEDKEACFYEADFFFYNDNCEYDFRPERLKDAHEWCRLHVHGAMEMGVELIGVSNTFTQLWEIEPYIKLCKQYGYTPFIVQCENCFDNEHGVPETAVDKQYNRLERIPRGWVKNLMEEK